jgi:hypothetical protein
VIVRDHSGGSYGGGYRNPGSYGGNGGGGYYGGGRYYGGGGYYNDWYYYHPYWYWRPGVAYGVYDPYYGYGGYGYGYGGYGDGYGETANGYYAPSRSPTWYLGAGLFGTRILKQTNTPENLNSGGGLSIYGGLHVGPTLSLEFGWMGSMHNPATVDTGTGPVKDYLVINAFTADAKIHFRNAGSGSIVPYVEGGIGLYSLGSQHLGTNSSGAGFQLGGGFDWMLGPHLSLGLRARYHGIAMTQSPDVMATSPGNGQVYISAATVEGALSLNF